MSPDDKEEKLLRSVTLQNSQAILLAREQAERELRESNERITSILESITDAFVVLDKDWRLSYINQQAEEVFQRLNKSRALLLGKSLWEEFPDLAGSAVEEHFRRALAEQTKTEFEFFYPTLEAWFEVRAYPSQDYLSIYFLDINDQKQAAAAQKETEDQLRRSEEELRVLADSIPSLAWMANPGGEIFWYNRRWYEYTGTTPEQMGNGGWQALHDPDILPQVLERWAESIRTGTMFEMEFPLRGADGVYRWFLTRIAPVRDAQGKLRRWFGTNTNIDEQRQLLQSLSEARDDLEKRVRERTSELAVVNENLRKLSASLQQVRDDEQRRLARELHDSVGQLLAAISMNIAVVQGEAHKLSPTAANCVLENATLVRQVSSEIRTISHLLHPPLLDEVGLGSALRWYADGFAERSKIKVELDIPDELGRLPEDTEIAIFRIVQECLTNIHRHSGSATAALRIRRAGHRLTVQVRDSGKGIPREKQRELTESGHAGIGLGGIRERLRQLGGTLEIQSDESGTLVTAVLEAGQEQPLADTAQAGGAD